MCVDMDLIILFYISFSRSPSMTTMRDIDPKLPSARHSLDSYSMSDGDWPADDRCVKLINTQISTQMIY